MFPESSPGAGGMAFKNVVATCSGLLPLDPSLHVPVRDGLPKIKVCGVWAHNIANANESASVPTVVSGKTALLLSAKSGGRRESGRGEGGCTEGG